MSQPVVGQRSWPRRHQARAIEPGRRSRRRVRASVAGGGLLWVIAGALVAAYLGAFGLSAASRLSLPVEYMYGESIVLDGARRVAEGRPLYSVPD